MWINKVIKLKMIFAILLIVAQVGLGLLYLREQEYKIFALGILYAISNVIIFIL